MYKFLDSTRGMLLITTIATFATWSHHDYATPHIFGPYQHITTRYFARMVVTQSTGDTLVLQGNRYQDREFAEQELIELNQDYHRRRYRIIEASVIKDE